MHICIYYGLITMDESIFKLMEKAVITYSGVSLSFEVGGT